MAIVTAEDVAAGVLTKWEADVSGVVALVSGGLHFQRVKATPTVSMPYAVLAVEEGEQEDFSGANYVKDFTVKVAVFTESDGVQDGAAIRRLLAESFDRASLTIPNASALLHVRPLVGEWNLDPGKRNANDVIVGVGAWEIKIQGSR